MKKFLFALFIVTMILAGCSEGFMSLFEKDTNDNRQESHNDANGEDNKGENEENNSTDETNENEDVSFDVKDMLLNKSKDVFNFLQDLNWTDLSELVHPDKGLIFSFYADLGSSYDNELSFTKDQVENLGSDVYVHVWGTDRADMPYEFTANDFVQKALLKHYTRGGERDLNFTQITYNDSVTDSAGTINTIHKYNPNAIYVEYYSDSTDPTDEVFWQALRFVYEKLGDEWYLYAIVRDVHYHFT